MNEIIQPLAVRRRTPTEDSSQILEALLADIMLYEHKYDPKLQLFHQALDLRIKEKYEEIKEEEPSPPQYTQQSENSDIFCDDAVTNNMDDDDDTNTLNPDTEPFHPRVDHRKLDTIIEAESEESDAEVVDDGLFDDGLFDQLESMKEDTLKDVENEKKAAKELAATRIKQDELEEMSDNDDNDLSPSSISYIPCSFTPNTQSPSYSDKSSISSLSTPVINITNIHNNNNVLTTSTLPISSSPFIIPNIYGLPPLIMPISSPPNLMNPLCSIPLVSNLSSSVPNIQINQPVVTSPDIDDVQYEQTTFTKNAPNYTQNAPNYTQNAPNYTQNASNYTQSAPNYRFQPKFNNHAKGNFYISKDMISRMVAKCVESFNTDHVNDEKLAFGYYKESVAMQINDEQIAHIIDTNLGLIIIINIDLHFEDGSIMYLIANENAVEYREKVRWCITDFMRDIEIYNKYGIHLNELPLSSRTPATNINIPLSSRNPPINMAAFQRAINNPPTNVSSKRILRYTNFRDLPKKTSKRSQSNGYRSYRTRISEDDLKYYIDKNWNNKSPIIPVVVIKGKKQWVEWKKFIQIYDDGYNGYSNSEELWIGISMRYYASNKQWKIECMDYDAGRIYYQHRLVGNTKYNISYNELCRFITTSLDIM